MLELTPAPAEQKAPRRRKRRDPKPHFKPDVSGQLDAVGGCPELQVPLGHLAREVRQIVAQMDTRQVEEGYSSLGRDGFAPKWLLALWVYGSLIGLHHATKLARALKTDAALRLLAGGHVISRPVLNRFRQHNGELFARALEQTVQLAEQKGLLEGKQLAVDSVRLRAHASLKAVRTRKRSNQRLEQLQAQLPQELSEQEREHHEAQVQKHREALEACQQQGSTSVVLTSPSAGLMKFPSGAGLPGHRVTVTACGLKQRLVVGVLIDAAPTDYGKLPDAVEEARRVLLQAGVAAEALLQVAADAGYWAEKDLRFAQQNRPWVDCLIDEPAEKKTLYAQQGGRYFHRERFSVHPEGSATCPAGRPMLGPYTDEPGKLRWVGQDCEACPLKPQCTPGQQRALTLKPDFEEARAAMRQRMSAPDAKARYNQRIATVEPVFSNLEDSMGFRRVSSRRASTVRAEILLKLLAHNVSRLVRCRPLRRVLFILGEF